MTDEKSRGRELRPCGAKSKERRLFFVQGEGGSPNGPVQRQFKHSQEL